MNLAFVSPIPVGGLGFPVLVNLYRYGRVRRLTVHTKLVLISYGILLVVGVSSFAALKWNHPATLGASRSGPAPWSPSFRG